MVGVLQSRRGAIVDACARHRVARLEVFGSALRDDFKSDESDVDLLVEFEPMEPYARVEAYGGCHAVHAAEADKATARGRTYRMATAWSGLNLG